MQEYYEGSKRSEDLLVLARRTLERLRKVGLLSYHLGKYLIKIFVSGLPGADGDGRVAEPVDHQAGVQQPGPRHHHQQQAGAHPRDRGARRRRQAGQVHCAGNGSHSAKYPDLRGVDKFMFTTVSLFTPKVDCGTVADSRPNLLFLSH